MNIQPSPQPPTHRTEPGSGGVSLRMVEQVSRDTQRRAFAWGVLAVVAFALHPVLPEVARGACEFVRWTGLVVALLYAGRWIQSTRLEQWLRFQAAEAGPAGSSVQAYEANSGPDWTQIQPSARLSVRSYVSVEEAQSRGWSFGAAHGSFDGKPVPAWAEFNGERFDYAGLATQTGSGIVPEHTRLFGRLRYDRPSVPALPVAPPPALGPSLP